MVDIGKIDFESKSEVGVWVDIKYPDGSDAGFRWKVKGPYSKSVIAFYEQLGDVRLEDGDVSVIADLVVAATAEIENLELNGVPVDSKNCKQILLKHHRWLLPQLMQKTADFSLFK